MTSALVKFEEEYPVLAGGGPAEIRAALQENLPGESLRPSDIDKAVIPSGSGAPLFTIPSLLSPDGEGVKEIVGVIVHQTPTRRLFEGSYEETGGDTPPICASDDGVEGIGNPGGPCITCPLSQFIGPRGSQEPPKCKVRRSLYILRPGQSFPLHVDVPTASYAAIRERLAAMVKASVPFWKVVVRLTLAKETNPSNLPYYQVRLDILRQLTPEESAMVDAYRAAIKPSLERRRSQISAEQAA